MPKNTPQYLVAAAMALCFGTWASAELFALGQPWLSRALLGSFLLLHQDRLETNGIRRFRGRIDKLNALMQESAQHGVHSASAQKAGSGASEVELF